MSILPSNNLNGFSQSPSNNAPVPNRHVSDNFSSSRSYAPEYHAQAAYILQRRLCEQLREEAKRERTKVSVACKDLARYIMDHQPNDVLVVGFRSPKDNPFREQKTCPLI